MVETTNVQSTASLSVRSLGDTVKSGVTWLGRQFNHGARAIKTLVARIWFATVDFFKNFPAYLRSGYGIGAILGTAGLSGLGASLTLKSKKQQVARAVATVAAGALLFVAGAVMFAFGRNPVTFSRHTF
ncbi:MULTISPECIES: hypothetical protein [unclassified Neochlamydia]|uniref:hypothetical protein n=1 Tax=unclassified Neochlamydia TaxID=2643326 RepID=UPI001409C6AF|nr:MULTISPECIES: hypothetical protein [unclassified Neochlamydia]MBS4165974.1 Uncharacterized protein [Neochlamydia sp. AcF65]